jgi:hypothetical protein
MSKFLGFTLVTKLAANRLAHAEGFRDSGHSLGG